MPSSHSLLRFIAIRSEVYDTGDNEQDFEVRFVFLELVHKQPDLPTSANNKSRMFLTKLKIENLRTYR